MKALLLDGPLAGQTLEVSDPPRTYLRYADEVATIAAMDRLEPAAEVTYGLVAAGDAGAVYATGPVDQEQAEDFANDPELWE